MPGEIVAGLTWKDLLQLGFSFFVAGWLLWKDWKLTLKVVTLLELQGQRLNVMQDTASKQTEILARVERVLERIYERAELRREEAERRDQEAKVLREREGRG